MTKSIGFIDINIGGLFSSFISPSSTMISRKMCFCHFCASVKTFCIIPDFLKMILFPWNQCQITPKTYQKMTLFFHVFVEFFFSVAIFSALLKLFLAVCLQNQTKAHNFLTLSYIELQQLFIPQVLIKVVHFY